jgi:hypothetical protein
LTTSIRAIHSAPPVAARIVVIDRQGTILPPRK